MASSGGRRRASMLAGACVVASLAVGGGSPAAPAPARTLLEIPGPIYDFAQDGPRIAWVNRRSDVFVRNARRGTVATIVGSLLDFEAGGCTHGYCGVTLAGDRAVFWNKTGAMTGFQKLFTASVNGLFQTNLGMLVTSPADAEGDHLVGPAGDGRLLVYGVTTVDPQLRPTGGRVMRLVRGRPTRIPGIGASGLLDVAAGRIAVVPAAQRESVVEVRDAYSGALLRTIQLAGPPAAVALSSRIVAVLRGRRIERYSVATGGRIDTTMLPATPVGRIDASRDWVVFQANKTVWLLEDRGRVRPLARTTGTFVGASIEGRRVAWAENTRKRSYVRAVTVS